MFRYTKLILAVVLTGCTTQAGEIINLPLETPPPAIQPNINLLETIEATLDVADQTIGKMVEKNHQTQDKISELQNTVNYEENLLYNLEEKLEEKDSLLIRYQENNNLLEIKLNKVEGSLSYAKNKCTTECCFTIFKLNQENQDLLYYVDSLQTSIFHLDSLISTNKRLSKKLK